MTEPDIVLADQVEDTVTDDLDVTHEEEDDEPDARAGDEVVFDLDSPPEGGV